MAVIRKAGGPSASSARGMRYLRIGALALASSLGLSATAGERPWYVAIEGGVNSAEIEIARIVDLPLGGLLGLTPPTPLDTSADDGWAMFAALGTNISENMRLEGELGHRSADFDDARGIRHTTLMANAMFDLPVLEQLTLSVGAGAGFDWIETDGTPSASNSFETSGTGFAIQGIASLSFDITERVAVAVSYRYLNASVPDNLYVNIVGAGVEIDDASTSSISAGLRLEF
jgi:opacity protein-like surface antigen